MGVRNILILFFSTMAVSLVILIVLFNLVFKNFEMEFDTRIPESAPTLESLGDREGADGFKAENVLNSSVRVPDGYSGAPVTKTSTAEGAGETDSQRQGSHNDADTPVAEIINPPEPGQAVPPTPPPGIRPGTPDSEPHRPAIPTAHIEPEPANTLYQVYIDGFASEEAARAKVDALKAGGVESFVSTAGGRPVVKLGTFSSRESADAVASQNGAKVRKVN